MERCATEPQCKELALVFIKCGDLGKLMRAAGGMRFRLLAP
jgi:hypothetical protein